MSEAIEKGALGARVRRRVCRRALPLGGWPWLALLAACGPNSSSEEALGLEESASSLLNRPQSETAAANAGPYTLFEADPVRPIAVLERSGLVAVTNTVDNSLELLAPTRRTVEACGAVPVTPTTSLSASLSRRLTTSVAFAASTIDCRSLEKPATVASTR